MAVVSALKTISVGQLRQNPTQMIRDVRAGCVYVLTDQGVPVADIAPHREFRGVPTEKIAAVLKELATEFGPDIEWQQIVEDLRDTSPLRDPWEDRK